MSATYDNSRDLQDIAAMFTQLDAERRERMLNEVARMVGHCPPWCRSAASGHDFDVIRGPETLLERGHDTEEHEVLRPASAENPLQEIELWVTSIERGTKDGVSSTLPMLHISAEQGTDLTADEVDRLIAMLSRWRRRLDELTQQPTRTTTEESTDA